MSPAQNIQTGLERISALEVEVKNLTAKVDEAALSLKAIESLMLQGRGAVRLVHWLLGLAAVFGAGWLGHTKLGEFLKWVGS